ncbi:hypothetical protein [Marinobacter sp. JSM 1782161]|uniref:hypothetical protein n=1 Tax=Marinobacter sp. JSM 1782161 TaxID=2685906 RepID=UPI00140422EC|nr:hypothetical protein [Marinobacter sp. JSM 1782161]
MIFFIPKRDISAADIAQIRKLCGSSISDIKQASQLRKALVEIEPFTTNWDAEKFYLAKLYRLLVGQAPVPFEILEGDSIEDAEFLSSEVYYSRLATFREIELEQQRLTDLEMGYIRSDEEFRPHDQDWL